MAITGNEATLTIKPSLNNNETLPTAPLSQEVFSKAILQAASRVTTVFFKLNLPTFSSAQQQLAIEGIRQTFKQLLPQFNSAQVDQFLVVLNLSITHAPKEAHND